jgi:glycosyltransferase involved in cell wall biosynthesis
MRKYSIIIPIFNRPDELKELLESLLKQTYTHFEVIVIEDGSTLKCDQIVNDFGNQLNIKYFYKDNAGQGFARNLGFEKATGDYFVQFDSDAIIPSTYFEEVENRLNTQYLDAYGGRDAAHPSFTPTQKAINFAMTSFLTTGGTRGKSENLGGKYHPRSFNFGLSRQVWEAVGGYSITRMGEDLLLSIKIIESGFAVGLIDKAFIYHKRRASLGQFYKQLHFFGRARINIARFYPKELKLVHFFPFLFMIFVVSMPVQWLISPVLLSVSFLVFAIYFLIVFFSSTVQNESIEVGLISVPACFIQLFAYGVGFFKEGILYLKEK